MATDGQQNSDGADKATANLAQDVHWITHATFWSQIGLGIIGIAALIIYGGQLRTMKSQLQQMQGDSKVSSEQFRVQLGRFDTSLGITQLQLGKLDASIAQASRLATATETANGNVLESDRPWIGGYVFVKDFEAGKKPTFTISFVNSGRRPAKVIEQVNAEFANDSKVVPNFDEKLNHVSTNNRILSSGIIVPGATFMAQRTGEPAFDELGMNSLTTDKMRYYAIARIRYKDVRTNKEHRTNLCYMFMPKGISGQSEDGFIGCRQFKDAD